jgi:hypothetical protein
MEDDTADITVWYESSMNTPGGGQTPSGVVDVADGGEHA